MNTDPPGTDEDIIDVIDVFVLCGNSSDATLLGQQLSPRGYRVTLFTDCTQLSDQIRAGKPNLLICDATSPEPDGYEFCRQLKADDDLWMIPVLLITGVSSLTDLLKVLDSNADNYVARPFNPQDLLLLIEDLIAERLEKPDPEQLKTRFKILHDDREYVIMADRRKLLEFLLSSYELAVDHAEECSRVERELKELTENLECQVKDRTQALSDEVKRLDGIVKEHARSHAQKDRNILDKERVETDLRVLVQDNEAIISRQAATITKITDELDQKNSLYAEAEEKIRTLTADKAQVEQSLSTKIDALCTERDGFKTELESTKRARSEAQKQIVALESRNANLAQEKVKTESTLRSCLLETDEVKSALADHKNRADIAEQEVQLKIETITESEEKIRTLIADKAQVEQLLHTEIDALCTERDGFKTELESTKRAHSEAQKQIAALESRNANLVQEKVKTESTLRSYSLETDKVKSALAEHKNRVNIAEQEIKSLMQVKAESEEKIRTLTADKAQVEQSLHTEIDALCTERDGFKTELESTKRAHSEAQKQIVALESRNANLAQEKGETESTLRSCTLETDEVKTELESTKRALSEAQNQISALESGHANLAEEKVKTESTLRSCSLEIDEVKSALAEYKNRAVAAEQEIKSIMQAKTESEKAFQQKVNILSEKAKQLADDLEKQKAVLDSETQRRIAFEQQIRILSQEKEKKEAALGAEKESNREHRDALLEKFNATTALLGAERQKNTTLSAEIQTVSLAKEQLSREMHTLTRRLAIAETAHEEETQLRLRSEKNAKDALSEKYDAVNSHQALLSSLDGDLKTQAEKLDLAYRERDSIKSSKKALDDELAVAVLGKVQSEKFAQSLSHEMEQLRAALETERRQRKSVEDSLEKERQLHLLSEISAREALSEKDEAVKSHQALLASLHGDLKTHAEKLELANREQDTIKRSRKKLEDELAAAVLGKAQSEKLAQSLSRDMEQLRAALETERQQRKSVEESLEKERQLHLLSEKSVKDALGEKDEAVKSHQALLASLHDDLKTHAEKLELANREQDTIKSSRKKLEDELAAAVLGKAQSEKFTQSLSHDIEQLRAALETEQQQRKSVEESLDQEKQAKDLIEQRLRTVTGEKGHEHDNLVIKFKKLNEDVEKGIALQKSLEQQLAATVQQQSEKEDALRTLSKEFEQLLAAFKAEQKNRHDLEKQLADRRENTQLKEDPESAHNHALTLKGPTLPRVIEHPEKFISIVDSVQPPRDPAIVPVEHGEPSTPTQDEISVPNIQSVEDLFEDDHEMDICELPNAIIEPEPVNKDVAVDSGTGHSGISVFAEPDTANVKSDSPVEKLAKETGGKEVAAITTNNAVPITADTGAGNIIRAADTNKESEAAKVQRIGTLDKHRVSPAPGSMKFDRRQWFDLIKWAHNTSSLSREEKLRFVRLGRLIQNGRNLNPRQEDQVSELVALAHSMGYKPG